MHDPAHALRDQVKPAVPGTGVGRSVSLLGRPTAASNKIAFSTWPPCHRPRTAKIAAFRTSFPAAFVYDPVS
jgi:hypothetical protein